MKKIKGFMIVIVITMLLVICANAQKTEAASKYIRVEEFIKFIVQEMEWGIDENSEQPYIDAALEKGIVEKGDFNDYRKYLTRGNALIILSRTDDYINGTEIDDCINGTKIDDYINDTEIDDWLLETVINKRISDIKDAPASKIVDIARGYIKGFIKGYSNGKYITNRNMKINNPITRSGALNCIKMIKDKSLRAKISPDGQLIRTTKLPRNADKYEYILECFPNKFYERQFEFMLYGKYKDPKYDKYYAYPIEMKNEIFRNWYDEWPLIEEMNKYLYDWQALAEEYLNHLFNVDYRTVDDEWIEKIAAVFTRSNLDMPNMIRTYYEKDMKLNKVIIESDVIAVEPSTFYMDDYYCMRAYVRYKITATDVNVDHGDIIYSAYYPRLNNLKSGEWREGIFDIRFGTNNGSSGDGSDFSIELETEFIDDYSVPYK